MKPSATVSITLDTRRQKKNGKYPVKLCINHITTAKYYATGIDLTNAQFAFLSVKRLSRDSTAVKNGLHFFQAKAIEIIKTLRPYSFTSFEKRFFQKSTGKGSLATLFQQQIDELTRQERWELLPATSAVSTACFHSRKTSCWKALHLTFCMPMNSG